MYNLTTIFKINYNIIFFFKFLIDSIGDKFFIILRGIVEILIRRPSENNPNNYEEFLFPVKTLNSGDSFGEIAILNKSKRLASIKCLSECYFGVLNK